MQVKNKVKEEVCIWTFFHISLYRWKFSELFGVWISFFPPSRLFPPPQSYNMNMFYFIKTPFIASQKPETMRMTFSVRQCYKVTVDMCVSVCTHLTKYAETVNCISFNHFEQRHKDTLFTVLEIHFLLINFDTCLMNLFHTPVGFNRFILTLQSRLVTGDSSCWRCCI